MGVHTTTCNPGKPSRSAPPGSLLLLLLLMNLGSKAKDLVLEVKRSEWVPPYNEEGVRGVLQVRAG